MKFHCKEAKEPVLLHPSQTRHSHLLPIYHFGPAATLNWNSGEGKKGEKESGHLNINK